MNPKRAFQIDRHTATALARRHERVTRRSEPYDPFDARPLPALTAQLDLPADIERFVEAARVAELERKGAGAEATLRAYRADWNVFCAWCEQRGRQPLPADELTVAQYIRYLIDRPKRVVLDRYTRNGLDVARPRREGPAHANTVKRHIVSIRKAHVLSGHADPTGGSIVTGVWKGIRRERGVKPASQKAEVAREAFLEVIDAIDAEHVAAAARAVERHLLGAERAANLQRLRDRAILLCGWSGALRRSEIARIDVEHLTVEPKGVHIELPFSKTNQDGDTEYVLIAYAKDARYCAVRAIDAWRDAAEIEAGPIFRRIDRYGNISARVRPAVVNRVVKKSAAATRLSPALFGAHSLRSGWITTAAGDGRAEADIMRHSRHLSIKVMRGYIRRANKWESHAGDGLL